MGGKGKKEPNREFLKEAPLSIETLPSRVNRGSGSYSYSGSGSGNGVSGSGYPDPEPEGGVRVLPIKVMEPQLQPFSGGPGGGMGMGCGFGGGGGAGPGPHPPQFGIMSLCMPPMSFPYPQPLCYPPQPMCYGGPPPPYYPPGPIPASQNPHCPAPPQPPFPPPGQGQGLGPTRRVVKGGCCGSGKTLIRIPKGSFRHGHGGAVGGGGCCSSSSPCPPCPPFHSGALDQPASYNNCNFYVTELPKGVNVKLDQCLQKDTFATCSSLPEQDIVFEVQNQCGEGFDGQGECQGQQGQYQNQGQGQQGQYQDQGQQAGDYGYDPSYGAPNYPAGDTHVMEPPVGYPGSERQPWGNDQEPVGPPRQEKAPQEAETQTSPSSSFLQSRTDAPTTSVQTQSTPGRNREIQTAERGQTYQRGFKPETRSYGTSPTTPTYTPTTMVTPPDDQYGTSPYYMDAGRSATDPSAYLTSDSQRTTPPANVTTVTPTPVPTMPSTGQRDNSMREPSEAFLNSMSTIELEQWYSDCNVCQQLAEAKTKKGKGHIALHISNTPHSHTPAICRQCKQDLAKTGTWSHACAECQEATCVGCLRDNIVEADSHIDVHHNPSRRSFTHELEEMMNHPSSQPLWHGPSQQSQQGQSQRLSPYPVKNSGQQTRQTSVKDESQRLGSQRPSPAPGQYEYESSQRFSPVPGQSQPGSQRNSPVPQNQRDDAKASQRYSSVPQTQYDAKTSQKLSSAPQQYDAKTSQKFSSAPQQNDAKTSQKFSSAPQQNDAKTSQKFSSAPQQYDTKASQRFSEVPQQQYGPPQSQRNSPMPQQYQPPQSQRNSPFPQQYEPLQSQRNSPVPQQYEPPQSQRNSPIPQQYEPSASQRNSPVPQQPQSQRNSLIPQPYEPPQSQRNSPFPQQYGPLQSQQRNSPIPQQYEPSASQRNFPIPQQYEPPQSQRNSPIPQQFEPSASQRNSPVPQQYEPLQSQRNSPVPQQYEPSASQRNSPVPQQYDPLQSQRNSPIPQQFEPSGSQRNSPVPQQYEPPQSQRNSPVPQYQNEETQASQRYSPVPQQYEPPQSQRNSPIPQQFEPSASQRNSPVPQYQNEETQASQRYSPVPGQAQRMSSQERFSGNPPRMSSQEWQEGFAENPEYDPDRSQRPSSAPQRVSRLSSLMMIEPHLPLSQRLTPTPEQYKTWSSKAKSPQVKSLQSSIRSTASSDSVHRPTPMPLEIPGRWPPPPQPQPPPQPRKPPATASIPLSQPSQNTLKDYGYMIPKSYIRPEKVAKGPATPKYRAAQTAANPFFFHKPGTPFKHNPPEVYGVRETVASILRKKPAHQCEWHYKSVDNFYDFCEPEYFYAHNEGVDYNKEPAPASCSLRQNAMKPSRPNGPAPEPLDAYGRPKGKGVKRRLYDY